MSIIISINRWIIGYSPIKHTVLWSWYRLINHRGWRLDDRHLYYDFWYSLNHGWEDMTHTYKLKEFWGTVAEPSTPPVLAGSDGL